MTIGSVSYQTFPIAEYANSGAHSQPRYSERIHSAPALERPEGADIDTVRAIDILLGHLEQISYDLSRTEARTEPIAAEAPAPADAEFSVSAAETEPDNDARFNALLEQYAQIRAEAETVAVSNPYAPAGPFAGMLFGIDT